jgi:hypothetical protein
MPPSQGHSEAGRIPRNSFLAVVFAPRLLIEADPAGTPNPNREDYDLRRRLLDFGADSRIALADERRGTSLADP